MRQRGSKLAKNGQSATVALSSAVLDRKLVRGPGHLLRPARTADRGQAAHAGRRRGAQPRGRGQFAGPAGRKGTDNSNPEVIVDLPEFPAVLDRELDAIEAYLGASLDEVLGNMGSAKEDTAKPSQNRVGESSSRCNNRLIKKTQT
jgi:hypothetical protein